MSKSENEFIAKKVLEINPDLIDKEHYYPWIGLQIQKRRNRGKLQTVEKYFRKRDLLQV